MTEITLIFTRLDHELVYDNSVEATEIDEIQCDKSSIANLNQANYQFKFYYAADFGYLLCSMDSGVLVKYRLRTRDNNNTNMDASITLASNLFGHFFDEGILRLGGNCIEHVRSLGVVINTFFHMQNTEFRHQNGQLCGFIPDKSNEISDTIGIKLGDIAGNDLAGVIASVKHANQKSIKTNENYNERFLKRRKLITILWQITITIEK